MDLSYTPEEEAFRARVRDWIARNQPGRRADTEARREWQRRLHQAGYLGAAWPKEHGGAGLSQMEQAILNEELTRAGAPEPLGAMGISWVGPAVLRFGSDEQKRRFVSRVLSGEDVWATGYSEPNAGSDMYNTQTRAVRDGDDYLINGQKIWTSLAHIANWYTRWRGSRSS
jgi:alkylation response protein AidB-like acyl-CoA dehydrogenase